MKKYATRGLALACMLALVLALVPVMAFAAGNGWQSEGGGWKYYKDGKALTGVNWIEAEGGREWVEITPAYDETYCTICGAVQ